MSEDTKGTPGFTPGDPREAIAAEFKRPATPEQWATLFKALFFCEHTDEQMVQAFRAVAEDERQRMEGYVQFWEKQVHAISKASPRPEGKR